MEDPKSPSLTVSQAPQVYLWRVQIKEKTTLSGSTGGLLPPNPASNVQSSKDQVAKDAPETVDHAVEGDEGQCCQQAENEPFPTLVPQEPERDEHENDRDEVESKVVTHHFNHY